MKVIVIGNGMVGYKFCEKLRSIADTGIELIVFGEEPRPAYDRVHLTSYLDGKTAEDLLLADLQWYQDNNIILHTGDPVTRIDRHRKTVHTLDGKAETYDYLVLATGSAAFVPPIPGIDKKGVFVYRTIEDLDAIRAIAANATSGIVIGGRTPWIGSSQSPARP